MARQELTTGAEAPVEPIRIETGDASSVLHLAGVVGVASAKRLRQLAIDLADSAGSVSVNCEHLQQLDCASVQVLLALHETLKCKGIGMKIQNMPDSVQQTLHTVGLGSAF